jgi:hypothetical protein
MTTPLPPWRSQLCPNNALAQAEASTYFLCLFHSFLDSIDQIWSTRAYVGPEHVTAVTLSQGQMDDDLQNAERILQYSPRHELSMRDALSRLTSLLDLQSNKL